MDGDDDGANEDDGDDDEDYEAPINLEELASMRELGDSAVWSVTTAKPGNGIEMLRDGDPDTFWQYEHIFQFILFSHSSAHAPGLALQLNLVLLHCCLMHLMHICFQI